MGGNLVLPLEQERFHLSVRHRTVIRRTAGCADGVTVRALLKELQPQIISWPKAS
jgi:hypothetical protein